MAIFHCSIKIVSRGKGKSAVASAAYRSGEKITNEYDGETHDYTRKGGIAFTGILLPDHTPKEYQDRSTLWNAVERVERSKNAQLARDIEVAIPKEIPREYWQRLMTDYCKSNFVSKGMIADFCIHDKDPNNPHCHILLTMRPIDKDGNWLAKSRKVYDLDNDGNRIKLPSGNWKSHKEDTTDWNSQDNAELWRENWSKHCNLYLENLGQSERIDHRSYERQGIDKIPSIHLGVQASQMEKKGIATERGNLNRQIAEDNKNLIVTRARITRLVKWQREEKARPLDLSQTGEKISVRALLRGNAPQSQGNRYQDMKALKNYASVLVFLEQNDISSIEDFYTKIQEMNKGFYVLKSEVTSTQKAIADMDNRMALWNEYLSLRPFMEKYKKLQGEDRKAVYHKQTAKIERYKIVNEYFVNLRDGGIPLKPKLWEKEKAKMQKDVTLCEWKMKAFKDELSRVEGVKKILELPKNEPAKRQTKDKIFNR